MNTDTFVLYDVATITALTLIASVFFARFMQKKRRRFLTLKDTHLSISCIKEKLVIQCANAQREIRRLSFLPLRRIAVFALVWVFFTSQHTIQLPF